jgi:hypothetical protein
MAMPTYLGAWALAPELSLYQTGAPPRSGLYRIEPADEGVMISISWETADGVSLSTSFGGPADGRVLQPSTAGAPAFSLTHIDDATLDSAAFQNGARIAYARRAVSKEGDLLATVQEAIAPDGTVTRNFQVYRRT